MSEARNYPHLAAALGEIRSPAHAPRPPADRPVGDAPTPRTAKWLTISDADERGYARQPDRESPDGQLSRWASFAGQWKAEAHAQRAEVARLTRLHGQLTGVLAEVEQARAREREINAELRATVERLKQELYEVKLAAAGGEDVPGSATTITARDVERWTKENSQTIRDQHDTIAALTALAREAIGMIGWTDEEFQNNGGGIAFRVLRARLATLLDPTQADAEREGA